MRITVVGMGNVGTQIAVHCAATGHNVVVYTSNPEIINHHLSIVDENCNITLEGCIEKATSSPDEAFKNAELIFVTMPAFLMEQNARIIQSYAKAGMKICLVPGTGGGECAFKECINKGAVIFGIQRVPSVARLIEKGRCVKAVGYRDKMHMAAIPADKADECCELLESILGIKTTIIPNYLNITLTPSNPILHTTRLYSIFRDYYAGKTYDSIPLFYEDWDDESSDLLLACDSEVQSICKNMPSFNLEYVMSLKVHYESGDKVAMTKKIQSITGFKGIKTPSISTDGGYIPDLNSRYFTADFSYGLSIIAQIAGFINLKVPSIQETMDWYRRIAVDRDEFNYSNYGINDLKDLERFYLS